MDSKKNTILLTVIAIATLLVAVVGATFAYFTAQGGTGTTADVTVTTGTAASSEFGTMSKIEIYANASSFSQTSLNNPAEGSRYHTGTSTGTVSWKAPGATEESTPSLADRTFCYTAKLAITTNTFVKSEANTTDAAELEFSAVKTPNGGSATTIIDKMDITTTTTDVEIPTTTGGSTYKHQLVAEAGSTVSDSWALTVTLVNLDLNQNDNTGKSFVGVIKFDKTDC